MGLVGTGGTVAVGSQTGVAVGLDVAAGDPVGAGVTSGRAVVVVTVVAAMGAGESVGAGEGEGEGAAVVATVGPAGGCVGFAPAPGVLGTGAVLGAVGEERVGTTGAAATGAAVEGRGVVVAGAGKTEAVLGEVGNAVGLVGRMRVGAAVPELTPPLGVTVGWDVGTVGPGTTLGATAGRDVVRTFRPGPGGDRVATGETARASAS